MKAKNLKTMPPKRLLPFWELPLFFLGFRPFYLVGAIFAALSLVVWSGKIMGLWALSGPMPDSLWHAHEMIFGFGAAILTGFLYTAVQNWTQRDTPHGLTLFTLVVLWCAGRVVMLTGPDGLAALVDGLFLPLAAIGLAIPLWKNGKKSHFFMLVLFGMLAAGNLMLHAYALGFIDLDPQRFLLFGLDVFAVFMTVMAGRIIPLFMNNALMRDSACSAGPARRFNLLDRMSIIGMLVLVATNFMIGQTVLEQRLQAFLLVSMALVQCLRLVLWAPLKTWRLPIVWILPLSYAWIPISLILHAASLFWPHIVPPVLGFHALAMGAMGGLMMGMMTRSALGHTARPLKAGMVEILCYTGIQLAALVRVAGPVLAPQDTFVSLMFSAFLWSASFALFAIAYAPVLTGPRLDGKPG